ncbi:DNA primase [Burkholderia phage Maja]|uniref:DNA primase n=1 Tax=Burkholderia phage Maja TaxID=2767571 RepID=A0A7S6R8A6_9CAUD|nr:DNA primase [Burkholderia phage Maja]
MTPKEKLAKCEEFLRELGRGIPWEGENAERVMAGYAEEATVQTDETGKKVNGGWWPVPWKDGKYINAQSNCYVCISSSIKTANAKGQMRYWRGEASFGHGLALMVDDIGTGKGSKGEITLEEIVAKCVPTAIVETSPGNHQLWYFMANPIANMRRFKAFLSSFVTHVLKKGGDNTIKDVSRYGRMPIGINNKRHGSGGDYKYAGDDGRPFEVRLLHADYSKRYEIEDIEQAFGFVTVMPIYKMQEVDPTDNRFDTYYLRAAESILSKMKYGEGSGGEVTMNMSGKYRIRCPWGHMHSNGDEFGAYFRGPIPGAEVDFVFGCGHDTCRKTFKWGWSSFIDEIVSPQIVRVLNKANRTAPDWAEISNWKGK